MENLVLEVTASTREEIESALKVALEQLEKGAGFINPDGSITLQIVTN